MLNRVKICLLIFFAKIVSQTSKIFHLGHGSTWPGHLVLLFHPTIFTYFSIQVKKGVILVAGTNGKTTTSGMIRAILEADGQKVIHNESGANLASGVISAFIVEADLFGKLKCDYAIFEVDEATLPIIIKNVQCAMCNDKKLIVVLLNLFRDQLDRYGEVDTIARKWREAISQLGLDTTLILNADDPQIAYLGNDIKSRVLYFGVDNQKLALKKFEHAADSIFCLNCGSRLTFSAIYYSHIGIWRCLNCGEERPQPDLNNFESPLPGMYNQYNTLAAVGAAKALDLSHDLIKKALAAFKPAFGRQEELVVDGKKVKIFLAKNPAGYNEALRTVINLGARKILLLLNDWIADGKDVSWIWDVDFEMLPPDADVVVSGDRVYDLAVRLKYAKKGQKSKIKSQKYKLKIESKKSDNKTIKQLNNLIVEENLGKAVKMGLEGTSKNKTLYILATYTAMLEARKILGGKKIL